MVFNINGTKLRLEFSFILIIAFSMLFNAEKVLKIMLFASLHEAGHITALYLFKGRADEINLAFYGIGLKHSSRLTPLRETVFLLSGVAVNLLLCIAGVQRDINLPLLIINALPVYPLDGGRALSIILPYKACRVISLITVTGILLYAVITLNISAFLIFIYIVIFSLKEEIK